MTTLAKLLANREKLNRDIERLTRDARVMALEEIQQIMADYELTVEDVSGPRPTGRPRKHPKPKPAPPPGFVMFRMPGDKHPFWTWNGVGTQPKWLRNALAADPSLTLEDFRVRS